MAYEKHNFADGNVLHAADLNAMEDQIAANEAAAEGAVQKQTDDGTHVYGHNGQNQTEYTVYVSPSANTIPYRTSGGRMKTGAPTEDNDAATKKYVDDHTVQDGSITSLKFSQEAKEWIRGARVYNVCDYGAVGDGVHDDAPAIREAIDDLPDKNWVLYFPPGEYLQGDGLNVSPTFFQISNKTDFCVVGYGAKIIANPNNSCVTNNRGMTFSYCERGVIQGIYYNGNISSRKPRMGDSSTLGIMSAFNVQCCRNLTFEDVVVHGAIMDAFTVSGDPHVETQYICDSIKFIRCVGEYCYRQGLSVINGHNGVVDSCTFSYTGQAVDEDGVKYGTSPRAGIDLEQAYDAPNVGQKNWVITKSRFVGNGGCGVEFHGGTNHSIVENSYFEDNYQAVFCIADARGLTVNNTVKNNRMVSTETPRPLMIEGHGGGLVVDGNVIINGTVTLNDQGGMFAAGKARRNVVSNNYIKYEFDPEAETYDSNGVCTNALRRVCVISDINCDFVNNVIVNATGTNPTYGGAFNRFEGNEITHSLTLPEGKWFGLFGSPITAKRMGENKVSSAYKTLSAQGKNILNPEFYKKHFYEYLNAYYYVEIVSPSRPMETKVKIAGKEYTIRYNPSAGNYTIFGQELLSLTPNTNPVKLSRWESTDDGKYRMLVDCTSFYGINVEIDILCQKQESNENYDAITVSTFAKNTGRDSLYSVVKKPVLNGAVYTELPANADYWMYTGNHIIYNNTAVYASGTSWKKYDGTVVTA